MTGLAKIMQRPTAKSQRKIILYVWNGSVVLRSSYQKLIQLLARPELSRQPAWLLATARPSLLCIVWIAVFGKDRRIGSPLSVDALVVDRRRFDLAQTLVQLCFFERYLASQFSDDLLVKIPKFV
jgi:hypothetical protein